METQFVLEKSFIQFAKSIDNWEDAIRISTAPLLENGYVLPSYIEAMIESVQNYGPYICIAPDIALPHARPEAGSVKMGYSILKVEEPVIFSEDPAHHSRLFIALSCVDADTHIKMLEKIVTVLSDSEKFEALLSAETPEVIQSIMNQI